MNDQQYHELLDRLQQEFRGIPNRIMGLLFLDYVVTPKRTLYPAIARLLALDCECRTTECRGCDAVEEWLASLAPEDDYA